jgi:hypothetical protein
MDGPHVGPAPDEGVDGPRGDATGLDQDRLGSVFLHQVNDGLFGAFEASVLDQDIAFIDGGVPTRSLSQIYSKCGGQV